MVIKQVSYTNQPNAVGILENEDLLRRVLPVLDGKPTKSVVKVSVVDDVVVVVGAGWCFFAKTQWEGSVWHRLWV